MANKIIEVSRSFRIADSVREQRVIQPGRYEVGQDMTEADAEKVLTGPGIAREVKIVKTEQAEAKPARKAAPKKRGRKPNAETKNL